MSKSSSSSSSSPSSSSSSSSSIAKVIKAVAFAMVIAAVQFIFFTDHSANEASYLNLVRWGTFRPNVYFGVKATIPKSPLMGLMWFSAYENKIRHDAEEGDKFKKYGWQQHDGRGYGHQLLEDTELNTQINTTFVQSSTQLDSFSARIEGDVLDASYGGLPQNSPLSLMWYISLPDGSSAQVHDASRLPASEGEENKPLEGNVVIDIDSPATGRSQLSIKPSENNKYATVKRFIPGVKGRPAQTLTGVYYSGTRVDDEFIWKAKDLTLTLLRNDYMQQADRYQHREQAQRRLWQKKNRKSGKPKDQWTKPPAPGQPVIGVLNNVVPFDANFIAFQLVVQLPFKIDIQFQTLRDDDDGNKENDNDQTHQNTHDETQRFDQLIAQKKTAFESKFEQVFQLKQKGFNSKQIEFAQAALSNMIGGVGHFYGDWIVQHPHHQQPVSEDPTSLLCTVPSRSFFPRGFMWDEGFHQLLVGRWDAQLSQEILLHWMGLVHESGWIPREQILGAEARRRVPSEFQVQRPHVANPPTLVLAINQLTHFINERKQRLGSDRLNQNAEEEDNERFRQEQFKQFLLSIYPNLSKHVEWYFTTQYSGDNGQSFRWHGRTRDHCLSSGLDDYPRAAWLTDDEGHVDLHSWMILLADTMANICIYLANSGGASTTASQHYTLQAHEFRQQADLLARSLDELHWSEKHQMYADYADKNGTRVFIPRTGYVTIFPFLLRLISYDDPKLGAILDILSDSEGMWSPWGILSLSRKDKYFGKGENYWRGNIWININYLAVASLHYYGFEIDSEGGEQPYQERAAVLYNQLRENLITNLFNQYEKTGFLWEQYSAIDGHGRKSHPFTGWTALIVLIMGELY